MAERGKNTGGKGKQKPVIVPDMGRLQPQARELEEAVPASGGYAYCHRATEETRRVG